MKQYLKFIIPIVIVVIIIGVTFYMLFDIKEKVEDTYYNTDNILGEEENTSIEDSTLVENEENTSSIENEEDIPQNDVDENDERGTTDKKIEAVELVKKEWGEDDTVSFRCDQVTAEGEYIVAVISKSSATVKNYFKVNLEESSVEIYY